MKNWARVPPWLPMIVLLFVFAPFDFAAPPQVVRYARSQGVRDAPACGLDNVSYRVRLNNASSAAIPPEPGKARVYFIHDGGENSLAYPTTRVALDGNWVGANHGRSYFTVDVNPGEHHACAMVQSSLVGPNLELAHFTTDASKTYYYRTRLVLSGQVQLLELEPLDSDQGKYLAATLPLSESKPK